MPNTNKRKVTWPARKEASKRRKAKMNHVVLRRMPKVNKLFRDLSTTN